MLGGAMSQLLEDRLNQILDKILSQEFLKSQGLGNEIGFWIFDYDAADELNVRAYIDLLTDNISKKHTNVKILHLNLLQVLRDYLTDYDVLEDSFDSQKRNGDDSLLYDLKELLHVDEFGPHLVKQYFSEEFDIIFMSRIGSVWPMLRAHNLLNKLHALLGHKPLVLFYPGEYDGQMMQLFGKIPSDSYYRAFKLVP